MTTSWHLIPLANLLFIELILRHIKKNTMRFIITGGWINIKMSSYQYRKSHCGDKKIYSRLISTMGFPILIRHVYIESGPWSCFQKSDSSEVFEIYCTTMTHVDYRSEGFFYVMTSTGHQNIPSQTASNVDLFVVSLDINGNFCENHDSVMIWKHFLH